MHAIYEWLMKGDAVQNWAVLVLVAVLLLEWWLGRTKALRPNSLVALLSQLLLAALRRVPLAGPFLEWIARPAQETSPATSTESLSDRLLRDTAARIERQSRGGGGAAAAIALFALPALLLAGCACWNEQSPKYASPGCQFARGIVDCSKELATDLAPALIKIAIEAIGHSDQAGHDALAALKKEQGPAGECAIAAVLVALQGGASPSDFSKDGAMAEAKCDFQPPPPAADAVPSSEVYVVPAPVIVPARVLPVGKVYRRLPCGKALFVEPQPAQ